MKILLFFVIGFVNLYSLNVFAETDNACVRSSGAITVTVQTAIVTDIDGNTGAACKEVPDEYRVKLYRVALCTANPMATSATDFSSCSYFINNDQGISHSITFPSSAALPITGLPAANTYGYMALVLNSGLDIKHSEVFSGSVTGRSGAGIYCWTIGSTTAYSNNKTDDGSGTLLSPTTSDRTTLGIDCGSSAGTAGYATEYIDCFCDNGETLVVDDTTGFDLPGGNMTARLLQSDNITTATTYNNIERLLAVIDFTTDKTVTSKTKYTINFKIQKAISLDLALDSSTIYALKMGADPFQIYLETN